MARISPFSEVAASAITARNNTHAGRVLARGVPELKRRFSQQDWRPRRRRRLVTEELTEQFSASREILDVAGPLAQRIAALAARDDGVNAPPTAARFARLVANYADAVHDFVAGLLTWADPTKQRRAAELLATRPGAAVITAEAISSGTWAADLAEMAAAADGLQVAAVYSDRLERLLRETVDRAALDLERKVAFAESNPPPPALPKPVDPRAELQAMGIDL